MKKISSLVVFLSFFVMQSQSIYNVLDYGVKQDTTYNSAKKIQKAIDDANQNGGGMVYFPPGDYMSGTIVL